MEPRTSRGRATRERIIAGAAELIGRDGVQATSIDAVLERAGVSKGQLYHYFSSKDALVRAVIARQTDRVINAQMPDLGSLTSFAAIAHWFDSIVALQARRNCVGGCPLGSLAMELADHDEDARGDLVASFDRWQGYLSDGLAGMQARGDLDAEADAGVLSLATLACIQGGLLLARTRRSTRPLRVALDAALAHLRTYRTEAGERL